MNSGPDQPTQPILSSYRAQTPDRQREPAGKRGTDGRTRATAADRPAVRPAVGAGSDAIASRARKKRPVSPCPSRRLASSRAAQIMPASGHGPGRGSSRLAVALLFWRRRRMNEAAVAGGCARCDPLLPPWTLELLRWNIRTLTCSASESLRAASTANCQLASAFLHGSTVSANGSGCLRCHVRHAIGR